MLLEEELNKIIQDHGLGQLIDIEKFNKGLQSHVYKALIMNDQGSGNKRSYC